MRTLALIPLLTVAAGFGSCAQPKIPEPPKVVYVTVDRYVELPPTLTAPCEATPKQSNTVKEAVRLANARLADVKACDARMTEIRKLQRKAEPTP